MEVTDKVLRRPEHKEGSKQRQFARPGTEYANDTAAHQ
jgi:hypothetical protein